MDVSNPYFISFYHDKRRQKRGGKYPIKLQVYQKGIKQKHFSIALDATVNDFKKAWLDQRGDRSVDQKLLRKKLLKFESRATEIAEQIEPFSIDEFELQYF